MAVLDDLPGIEVDVRINGEPLVEYDDDEEYQPQGDEVPEHRKAKTVSKYIKSETDAEFTVNLSVNRRYNFECPSIDFLTSVDGIAVSCILVRKSTYLERKKSWKYASKGYTSRDLIRKTKTIQNFKFAKVETNKSSPSSAPLLYP
jgi:hypothetical protein